MKQGRSGHTLLEVIAVVAVLAAVGVMALPLIRPMLTQQDTRAAADLVQARFSQLQSKAVSDGRAYRFEFQKASGKFRCVPEETDSGEDEDHWILKGDLPGDVKFPSQLDYGEESQTADGWVKYASFMQDGTTRLHADNLKFGSDAVVLHGAIKPGGGKK